MSTCTTGQCGVGGWGGPLPGDPSNDSVLSATPAFGGIEVSWNLPATNPHAVAYVKLWRSLTGDFAAATIRTESAGGSYFFDRIDTPTRYYYWIQIVSRNGTVGELIGPATAVAKPTITAMIEQLTGEIDTGLLAQSLKERLDEIVLLRSDLQNEVMDRETGETALSEAIADAQAGIAQAHTFILNETATRTAENSAIVEQLTGVVATLESEIASVQTLLQASIDELTGDVSALQTTQVAVQGRLDTAEGSISAIAGTQTTQQASINTINGTISTMQTTQSGFQTSLNGYAGVQTTLTTNLNTLTGTVNAMYTAKVDVNGLIGGFGLANNGTTVEAGFDVDKFWVGRTTNKVKPFIITGSTVYISTAVIPVLTADKINGRDLEIMSGALNGWAWPAAGGGSGFYLGPQGLLMGNFNDGRYVRIDSDGDIYAPGFSINAGTLLLNDGTVGGIQINSTDLRSTGWVAGTSGFRILSNGNAEFFNVTARGDIRARSLEATAVDIVDTLHISGNAVTIPVGAFSAGIDTDNGVTQSITIVSTGQPIRVDGGCTVKYGGSSGANSTLTWELRRVRSGVTTTLMSGTLNYTGNTLTQSGAPFSLPTYKDQPGTGTVTYQLYVTQGNTELYNRGMFGLELKR